ncbi:MAG: hypothetical protein JW892_00535 [Anaerolineae bacterium]|nr:hypothetical protein [Anaerolineae bacterium]
MSTTRSRSITFYAVLLLLPLLAAFPLWGPGMVNTRGGGDSPFLLQRTLDMAENLRHGIFPVRWMAHAAYDLGYPFFNHYAALPFYLSGGLTALGFSPILAIQATQTLGFILAALAIALWARRVYRKPQATLLAVAAYTFAPFHLVNVYVRGDSLSEFYAFIWYPLILWALDRAAERYTPWRVTLAALSYAALLLTHNVSALIFAPFALLYAVPRQVGVSGWHSKHEFKTGALRFMSLLFRSIAPFLLAFLLTAWFWIPAIGETGYGQMGPEFTAGYFHYSNHFRGLNLVQRSFFFDYTVAGEAGAAGPFVMGLVQAALALLGAGVLLWHIIITMHRRQGEFSNQDSRNAQRLLSPNHYAFVLFSLLISTFMITPLSSWLWEHLPLLEITQFPWRFLSVQALFAALALGAIAGESMSEPSRGLLKRLTHGARFAVPLLLVVLAALGTLHPERLLITSKDITWDNLLLYEAFTGNIGTTIRYEYLPADVKPRLYISESVVDGVDMAKPISGNGAALAAELLTRTPNCQEWQLKLDTAAPVAFPLNWWPGWHAQVDGSAAATYSMTGSGRLTVDLAAGEHTVVLQLRNTPLRAVSLWVSAVTLVVISLWLSRGQRREDGGQLRGIFLFCAFALGISLLAPTVFAYLPYGVAPNASSHSLMAFDFIQAPYPHREPVRFGSLLLEEVYATSGVSTDALNIVALPGETIGLGLRWQQSNTMPLTGTLRLVSPAEPRHGVPYALAEATFVALPASHDGLGGAGVNLVLPPDLARGLYLLELRFYGPEGELQPQTPQGVGRGTLYVGAVRVRSNSQLSLATPAAAQLGELTLHSVSPLSSTLETLRLQCVWSLRSKTPRNWSFSLRLLDADGRQLSQADLQPGYGYLPTTLWQPGERVTDYPVLSLPEGLAPGVYTLRVIVYLEATMETAGEADLPITITQMALWDPRESCCEWQRRDSQTLCQADGVSLIGLRLPEASSEGSPLDFFAEWSASEAPIADLNARWEVLNAAGETVALREGTLASGSPTTLWSRFAWVRAPVTLELPPQMPDGPYSLHLTLLSGAATLQHCDLGTLNIVARPRSFALPTPAYSQQAHFGTELRLLGYDFGVNSEALTLTLWWQAQAIPSRDYKRFVHVMAPSGEIVAQDDAMPRAWTYPTSWWAAGEVVSETVTLAALPGEYRIGVGWYDGDSGVTLPATDAAGAPWADNRVILDETTPPGVTPLQ